MKKGLQRWIGTEIREQRLRLSLSLEAFALKIGVYERDAEAIESGTYEVNISLLFRIASVLGMSTSRLVRRAEGRGRRLLLKGGNIERSPNKKRVRRWKPSR
jgi:transcriptional regulator with XRE-family HTH domain